MANRYSILSEWPEDPEEEWRRFHNGMTASAEKVCGKRKAKGRKAATWWNEECKEAINDRNEALKKYKRHQINKQEFRIVANKTRSIIRSTKREDTKNKWEKIEQLRAEKHWEAQRIFWDEVGKARGKERGQTDIDKIEDSNMIVLTEEDKIRARIRNYYMELLEGEVLNGQPQQCKPTTPEDTKQRTTRSLITMEELRYIIAKLKDGKAPVEDEN